MAKTMKSDFEKVLSGKVVLTEEISQALQKDPQDTVSVGQAIVCSIIGKAMRGDLQAAAFIRDTLGEKPGAGGKTGNGEKALTVRIVE